MATSERAAEISLILGSAASRDAGAQEALAAMRTIVPYVGIAMCMWDPVARTHRAFVNDGYPDTVMDYLCRDYFALDAGYRHILAGPRNSARWRDVPIDYEQTYSVEAVFGPAGYREGLTARLTTRDGRLTGALHVSTDVAEHPSDLARDAIEWLVPAFAAACDVLSDPAVLVASLEPGAAAAVVSPAGTATALPGCDGSRWLRPDGELVALARTLLIRGCRERRFLWEDDLGGWHRVHVLPLMSDSGMAVICEMAIARVPHELTARELDILTLLAAGLSNRAIAERLTVSQRTVATHIEHVFEKLASHTRTGCAALAIEEGLLREPLSG